MLGKTRSGHLERRPWTRVAGRRSPAAVRFTIRVPTGRQAGGAFEGLLREVLRREVLVNKYITAFEQRCSKQLCVVTMPSHKHSTGSRREGGPPPPGTAK